MNAPLVRFFSAFAIAAAIAWPNVALAGTTGTVSGRVYDDGRPLVGATVEIFVLKDRNESRWDVDTRTHETAIRTTDANGFFVFMALSPGYYLIGPSFGGKYFYCPPRVVVDADQSTFVALSMADERILGRCTPPRFIYPISERLPQQGNNW